MSPDAYLPVRELIQDSWPRSLGAAPDLGAELDKIGVGEIVTAMDDRGLPVGVVAHLAILTTLRLDLPFLPGLSVSTGSGSGVTEFTVVVRRGPRAEVAIRDLALTLSADTSLLQLWRRSSGRWERVLGDDGQPAPVRLTVSGGVTVDLDSERIALDTPTLRGPAAGEGLMVGSSGVIVHGLEGLQLVLQDGVAGVPPGFRGIHIRAARITYVQGSSVLEPTERVTFAVENCGIGEGGFTGTIRAELDAATTDRTSLPGGTIFGVDCRLRSFGVTFDRSIPTGSSIGAYLKLPFFSEDDPARWLALDASIGGRDGQLLARISGAGSAPIARVERSGLLRLELSSLAFRTVAGTPGVEIGGRLTPLVPGFEWPTFDLDGLRVDARGEVQLPNGRLELPRAATLRLGAFQAELTAISFGDITRDGAVRSSFGFSGGIRLSRELGGAEVRNLRVSWPRGSAGPVEVTLDGITVRVEVPRVLRLDGAIDFDFARRRFSGMLALELQQPRLRARVAFALGEEADYRYWYLSAGLQLPFGIPLAATGLALYGGDVLAGENWAPRRTPEQSWFEDWYMAPPIGLGVAGGRPEQKWQPRQGSLVFGAGVVAGTAYDQGFSFGAKALVVVSIPGPTVFLEGRAQFLANLADIEANPPFRVVAILDVERGEFLLGLAVQYSLARVIEISGTAELYFKASDPAAWHLWIGRDEPESKRIQATILSIFRAQAYFMLSGQSLRTGASVGWSADFQLRPLGLRFRARLDQGVEIFWDPFKLAGHVAFEGDVRLSLWFISIGLSLSARLEAEAPRPFRLAGHLRVRLQLPWPLPEVAAEVALSWSDEQPPDLYSDPIADVSLQVRTEDRGWAAVEAPDDAELPPDVAARVAQSPVPVDANPVISFTRPVDPGRSVAGVPPSVAVAQPGTLGYTGEELPGVPGSFVSTLRAVEISRWDGARWQPVAMSENPAEPWEGRVDLQRAAWGTWRPARDRRGDAAALQFELWNRYAFSRSDDLEDRWRGRELREHGRGMCATRDAPAQTCTSFVDQPAGRLLGPRFHRAPGTFTCTRSVAIASRPGDPDFPRTLLIGSGTVVEIVFDQPMAWIECDLVPRHDVVLRTYSGTELVEERAVSADGTAAFAGVLGGPLTRLTIDAGGAGDDVDVPFSSSAVRRGAAVAGDSVPDPAEPCLRAAEDALLALVALTGSADKGVRGDARDRLEAARARLLKCESGKCAEKLDAAVVEIDAILEREGGEPHEAAPATSALAAVVHCLSAAVPAGARCEALAGEALDESGRPFELVLKSLEEGGVADLGELAAAVLAARGARAQLAICRSASKPTKRVVAVAPGDQDDAATWLREIPALTDPAAADGVELRQLCWRTARDEAYEDTRREMHQRFEDLLRQFDADDRLLEPHTTYKVSVEATQENAAVSREPSRTFRRTAYFQTGGPPGDYRAGDPLDRLEPYLSATVPADGATGVFGRYGVGLVFARTDVQGMYAWPGTNLELEILGPDGAAVTVRNAWSTGERTSSRAHEDAFVTSLSGSTCERSSVPVRGDRQLVAELPPAVRLAPMTRYTVRARGGARGHEREVARFSFTTGRYGTFAESVADARTTGAIARVRAPAAPAGLRPPLPYDAAAEGAALATALAALGLAPRTRPRRLVSTMVAAGGASYLLLEFADPVDFRRLSLRLHTEPDTGGELPAPGEGLGGVLASRPGAVDPVVLRSADGHQVLLAAPDGRSLEGQLVSLLLTFSMTVLGPPSEPAPHRLYLGAAEREVAGLALRHREPA